MSVETLAFHPLKPSSRCLECNRPAYYCATCGDYYHADNATCFLVREAHGASHVEAVLLHEEAARRLAEPSEAVSGLDARACAVAVSATLGITLAPMTGEHLSNLLELHVAYVRAHRHAAAFNRTAEPDIAF